MAFNTVVAAKTLQKRAVARRKRLALLENEAQRDAERIINFLIEKYQPKRIYRWGSLITPGMFREWSDIDIALEGLCDPLAGLRALDDACRMTRFPVDLVEIDRIDPRHAEDIRKDGRLVYARDEQ